MAGYSRQSVADIIANAVIRAAPVNAEYNAIRDAFAFATGHKHDGSSTEGAYVPLIADTDALNKVVVDTANNRISFYSEVGAAAVEQLRIQDGAIVPVTDDDIDLGATGAKFKDLYIDGIGYIDDVTVTGTATLANVDINAGAIDNTVIGNTTAVAGTFTDLTATGTTTITTVDINGGAIDGTTIGSTTASTGAFTTLSATGTSTLTTVDINGGTIDGTTIGASSAAAGSFTTVSTSGQATLASADINGGTIDGAVIGGASAAAITGTTITGTSLVGPVTGNVTGNLTGNVTGNVTGDLTGDVTGNVTAATGTTTLNDLIVNGTVDFTSTALLNVSDPTAPQQAATKNYVDTQDALKLNLTGGTMSGAIAMGTNQITGLGAPTLSTDAATKGYVDTEVANLVDSAPGTLDTLNELAAALNDDPNFSTTITTSIATKLPLAGGTMTGDITMGANAVTSTATPATADTLTRKGYVDTQDALKLDLAGGTMSGAIAMGTNKITGMGDPTVAQDAATKAYVDTQDATKLNLSGGTMSGAINMGSNLITNVTDPSSAQDAATKNYIDTLFGSTTDAAASAAAAATSETNAATSETNAANSATAAASSATDAAASYDSFDDRYLGAKASGPATDNDGDALITGALYFDTTANLMKVYDGSSWVDAGSAVNGTSERQVYTATSGQTTFAVTYDVGFVDVWLNGVKLVSGTDFTATSGTSIVLTTGAAAGDIVDIIAYGAFNVADTYTQAAADARFLQVSNNLSDIGDAATARTNLGVITTLVEDTTPQLGGDLDLNSSDITGTGNISITGTVNGRNLTTDGTKLDNINQGVATTDSPTFVTLNATTVDFGNWTITESGGSLYFATGGTNKMKLDASGNLDVVGNVNSNATIT